MHSSKSVQIYKYHEKSNASHCNKSSFKSLRNGSSRTTSSLKAVQNQNVRLNQRWRVASGAFKPFYFIVCITLQCIWIVAILSLISCTSILKSSNLKHFSQSSYFRTSYQFFTCDENAERLLQPQKETGQSGVHAAVVTTLSELDGIFCLLQQEFGRTLCHSSPLGSDARSRVTLCTNKKQNALADRLQQSFKPN